MEIKEVYLDLKEWPQYAKKNKSVFKLESEAFKEPLKFKFVYDDSDLNSIRTEITSLKNQINHNSKVIQDICKAINELNTNIDYLYSAFNTHLDLHTSIDTTFDDLYKAVNDSKKETKDTQKRINDLGKSIDFATDKIGEYNRRLEAEKPMIFEVSDFVSWNGVYYFNTLQVPCGDYAVIRATEIISHNEYVLNRDSTEYYKIHVDEKWYTPSFQLQANTWLDMPTATVKITFLFFPM